MIRWISQTILNVLGWKVSGDPSNELKKKLYIVVPHTSSLDFFVGMLIKSSQQIKEHFSKNAPFLTICVRYSSLLSISNSLKVPKIYLGFRGFGAKWVTPLILPRFSFRWLFVQVTKIDVRIFEKLQKIFEDVKIFIIIFHFVLLCRFLKSFICIYVL